MTAPSESGDRRRFLKLLAMVGMSSAIQAPAALAQPAPAKPVPAQPDTTAAPKPPEISPDTRSLVEIVRRRYGAHLNAEQIEALTKDLDGVVKGGLTMRKFKLQNGDEPQTIFRP